LFVFEGNGQIRDFPGNYAEYRLELADKNVDQEKIKSQMIVNRETPKEKEQPIAKRKPSFNEKREFELLEKEIAALNDEKALISSKLADAGLDYQEIEKISKRFTEISQFLDVKELRWLELSELF
jgi:ATP-binding cassette subfamily F protein uup